jgi:hypothetical protein
MPSGIYRLHFCKALFPITDLPGTPFALYFPAWKYRLPGRGSYGKKIAVNSGKEQIEKHKRRNAVIVLYRELSFGRQITVYCSILRFHKQRHPKPVPFVALPPFYHYRTGT